MNVLYDMSIKYSRNFKEIVLNVPNHSRTECVTKAEDVPFYGTNEFEAIISVIGVLSGCGCVKINKVNQHVMKICKNKKRYDFHFV